MSAPCAIWASRTVTDSRASSGDVFQYDSPRAGGRYEITGSAKRMLEDLNDSEKALLTTWLVEQRQAGDPQPRITSDEIRRAKIAKPRSLPQRRDGLLLMVSGETPRLGQTVRYYEHVVMRTIGEPDRENPHWKISDLMLAVTESLTVEEAEVLVRFAKQQDLLSEKYGEFSLTFRGHQHLEELRAVHQVSTQAFVAMWFNDEVSAAYHEGIALAIADAGYKPMRIDQKEHSNKIDDEIIAEIRRSRFVVADFTCGLVEGGVKQTAVPRGGVYYEAGFAQGLGIPVIWCVRADHIDHVHFDTRQFNHITWATPQELREKLVNRIGAVLGDGPFRS